MAPRTQPTARQVRLGAELRRLREAAGTHVPRGGGALGVDPAQMSQIEAGCRGSVRSVYAGSQPTTPARTGS